MTERILVTGVSGFLGGHVALQLLIKGYDVRSSIRDLAGADGVARALAAAGADVSRLEFRALDLLSDTGWAEAAEGCRCLLHIASPFVLTMPKEADDLIRPAVDGTRRALTAALNAGHKRIVLTSSLAAIDGGHTDWTRPLGPSDWTDLDGPMVNAYTRSKTLAEREAWRLVEAWGRREKLAVINPGAILGPLLDNDPGTSGLVIQRLLKGAIPIAPDIRLPYVDVRDVAAAHIAAMEREDAGGRRHLVANPVWSLLDLAKTVGDAWPDRRNALPRRTVPNWMTRAVGMFDPSIRASLAYLGIDRRYDDESGVRLLGHSVRGSREAASAMACSLIERGMA